MKKARAIKFWGILLISFIIGLIVGHRFVGQQGFNAANSDYAQFWLGGRMILDELNPYDAAQWQSETAKLGGEYVINKVYIYPLPLTLLFAPLALFSLETSFAVWIALSISAVMAVGLILFHDVKNRKKWAFFPLYLVGAFLLRGTLATLVGGHLGGVLAVFFVLGIFFARREQWFWAGFFIAFTVLKPTITGAGLLLIAIWLVTRKNWRGILGGAAGGAFLFTLGFLKNPIWIQQFLNQGQEHGGTYYLVTPTLWGLAGRICQLQSPCAEILASILSLALFGYALWQILRHPARSKFGFVIALAVLVSLMVTPYLWAHDHVLLVLPFAILFSTLIDKEVSFLYSGVAILGFVLFAFGMIFVAIPSQQDQWSVSVPLILLGILMWGFRKTNTEHG